MGYIIYLEDTLYAGRSYSVSSVGQGMEGLLARDSPESLVYVLLYSLLSTVQI